jgi:hypothetical protein
MMFAVNDFKRICARHLQEGYEFIEKYKDVWSSEPSGVMFDEEAAFLFIKEDWLRRQKILKEILHECNEENLAGYVDKYIELLESGQVVTKNYLRNAEVLH